MHIVHTISEAQRWCNEQRRAGRRIGFVPTMGYLHEGHTSLIDKAKAECDVVACSIFVNPTQFAAHEDLSHYPRDFERDSDLLIKHQCDLLFAPSEQEMYPAGFVSHVRVGILSAPFEGAYRPTHFDGVCLIVTKLLMAVKAQVMYLGQKDYQQTLVLRQLIRDLNIDVHVSIEPTVREADGLALSSRNVYLSPEDRAKAPLLFRALQNVHRAVSQDIRNKAVLDSILIKTLSEGSSNTLRIDYAACVLASDLREKEVFEPGDDVVALLAVRIGKTRLIDNALLHFNEK